MCMRVRVPFFGLALCKPPVPLDPKCYTHTLVVGYDIAVSGVSIAGKSSKFEVREWFYPTTIF